MSLLRHKILQPSPTQNPQRSKWIGKLQNIICDVISVFDKSLSKLPAICKLFGALSIVYFNINYDHLCEFNLLLIICC
jgi:hypothetical protein